ncbi:MAG: SPOR domain-containing protein [Pseudomonadota bacterium]
MTMRGLIVLLAVLNLGVAAWWLFRAEPAPMAVEEDGASGLARLQLAGERPELRPRPAPTPAASPTVDPAAAAPPAPESCVRIGPYADAATATNAQTALRPIVGRLRLREQREGDGRGWRVFLPAAADRAAADATATRIRAAGFEDLLVVADGAEANSIALGRFSTEARARQHVEALLKAGFPAQAQPLGEARIVYWIELAVTGEADPASLRRLGGATQARAIDCAALR